MLLYTTSFVANLYFLINRDNNLQSSDCGNIFVHFLIVRMHASDSVHAIGCMHVCKYACLCMNTYVCLCVCVCVCVLHVCMH